MAIEAVSGQKIVAFLLNPSPLCHASTQYESVIERHVFLFFSGIRLLKEWLGSEKSGRV
jgi:hypothetical protein